MFGLGDAEEEEGYVLNFFFFLLSFLSFFCLLLIPLFFEYRTRKIITSHFYPFSLLLLYQKPKTKTKRKSH